MIPKTDDGRVLFAVPWHNKVVLGTTDTPVEEISDEPVPLEEEVDFILSHISRYLAKDPQRSDIKSMFAGLRPLVKGKTKKTASLSRDHLIQIAESGLITVTGGKWTTYRKMAEDVVDIAIEKNGLENKPSVTAAMKLSGYDQPVLPADITGESEERLKQLVQHSASTEMCITVEDFLARRTRQLLLDANAAIKAAPWVAGILAEQFNKDKDWVQQQINNFNAIAKNYSPTLNLQL